MKRRSLNIEEDGLLSAPLSTDEEVQKIIDSEIDRQRTWLNLVASENFVSKAVLEAQSTILGNKYSEGYTGARHYGGNLYIDEMEQLCQKRALQAFSLDRDVWGVNVQSLSGTQANFEVYYALMHPHDRMMGLSLTHGGHMSFGYQTDKLKVSAVSTFYETLPYRVDLSTGRIDYDDVEDLALRYRPKVIVAGASSYCRVIDYARLRKICNRVGAFLVADVAHIAGQIAAGVLTGPWQYADVVTAATQKTLRGPRGALIFFRKSLEAPINFSVFPSLQGGPHNHTICALTVALGQAMTKEFKDYQNQLMLNAKALESALVERGYSLVSGGTDIHLLVVSLRGLGVDGIRVNAACEKAHIAISATTVPGDTQGLPGAIRLGTTAMTTRGFKENDFVRVAELIDRVVKLTVQIQEGLKSGANQLRDFKAALSVSTEFLRIADEISDWVTVLPLPQA